MKILSPYLSLNFLLSPLNEWDDVEKQGGKTIDKTKRKKR
jgi:hypothetical protein